MDKPNQADVRKDHREAHMAYLHSFNENIVMAGPLLADNESYSVGSLFVLDFPDRTHVEAFTGGDPFNKAGIFESVVIRPYKQIVPRD
ncbi:MAG: YciI family protein [Rhodospirillales bacterium]|nr:YciI family protein [Rhodospirillales bacterium]HJN23461.1 YciI family protein [Rhodospirillales bacterium]